MLSTTKPICWKCQIEMAPEKNGVHLVGMAHFGPQAIWNADLWYCPECGIQVVVGLGSKAWAERHEPGWLATLEDLESETRHGTEWTRRIYAGMASKRDASRR